MRSTRRIERNQLGAWVSMPQNQTESTADDQAVAIPDDIQVTSPEQNVGGQDKSQSQTINILTLKRWKIETTLDRVQVCLWTLFLIAKLLSTLAVISFWIAAFFTLKTLPVWNGPQRVFDGYVRRRNAAVANARIQNELVDLADNFWEDLFPAADNDACHQLNVQYTDRVLEPNVVLFQRRLPILLNNPVVWMLVMMITFSAFHMLSFVQDCLRQANHVTRTQAKRRRPAA
jgi:hypothetical protein